MSKKKTNEQFLIELKQINENIIPEEPYINTSTKIQCRCAKCGHIWASRPNALLRGCGCPKCAGNIKKSNADFVTELLQTNPNVEPLEEYQGNKTPILCRCRVCGTEWRVSPSGLLRKMVHCPMCSQKQRSQSRTKTNDDFVKQLSLISPSIIPLEPYISSSDKIQCKCRKCGHIWAVTPNQLLSAESGCPECNHTNTSVIEQIIRTAFSIAIGESSVISRDRKAIHRELDVYIPELKLAIEFGAWFWHKDKLKKDNEKQQLCAEKGIRLVTILEKCPDTITEQLIGEYRIFKENLSAEKDYRSIQGVIQKLFSDYSLSFSQVEAEWNEIVSKASLSAQKRNREDFIKLLSKANPSIELIGNYTRADGRVRCACKNCGHEWSVYASSLLSGHGCPKCAKIATSKKRMLSNEDFIKKLSSQNPNIEPLEPYIKSTINILCKCKVCGNMWSARPANLLFGRGCPKCGHTQNSKKRSKPIRCVETGECYNSIAEVTKMGIYNVVKCLKGRQQTAGGYHWEYVND